MKRTRKTQWVALGLVPHLGAKTLRNLRGRFDDDLGAALAADEAKLLEVPGVGVKIARGIAGIDLAETTRDISIWEKQGIKVLTPLDKELYPAPLRGIPDYPLVLFVRGEWHPGLWREAMAIVGTRTPSPKAESITWRLAANMARDGRAVVSGLALGIDAAAHDGAMRAGGASLAVLGSCLLHVYPPQNEDIAKRLRQSGALISEVRPDLSTNAQRLVSRNRIISAMSSEVTVVESDEDGGAMHAARFAREQARPIYACDLPAAGNQMLIQQGAKVMSDNSDFNSLAAP